MRSLALSLAVVATATASAHAEQARPGEPGPGPAFAIAINVLPVDRDAIAASAWVGWNGHHAIRANLARYRGPAWLRLLAPVFSDGEEDSVVAPDAGQTTDVSLGWVYYPRRLLDGASLEASVLGRFDRRRSDVDDPDVAAEDHHTNAVGGRVLVGWTWRLSDGWFIATAVGGALGYEHGREKTYAGADSHGDDLGHSARVSRIAPSLESYVRIGLAFGP